MDARLIRLTKDKTMKFHAVSIVAIALAATAGAAPPNTLTFETSACLQPGEVFTVDVALGTLPTAVVGAQALLRYDNAKLQLLGQQAGDPAWSDLIYFAQNSSLGTIDLAVGMQSGSTTHGVIRKLVFRALSSATSCTASGLVAFRDVPGIPTRCTTSGGAAIVPTLANLGSISIADPPSIIVPADVTTNMLRGQGMACLELTPATGTDACGGSASISFVRSDGATSLGAPFAVNTSHTITWTATDGCGRTTSAVQNIRADSHIADFNADGRVDGFDLAFLLAGWGAVAPCEAVDLDGDGMVNGGDLALLLARWGLNS